MRNTLTFTLLVTLSAPSASGQIEPPVENLVPLTTTEPTRGPAGDDMRALEAWLGDALIVGLGATGAT